MKGISIVEVFEREEKSVIFVCKNGLKRANGCILSL